MQPVRILKNFFFLFVLMVFAACGNVAGVYDTANGGGIGGTGINNPSAGGGIGGTGISGISVGKITKFGSIFVNNVEFATTGATITIEGNPAVYGQGDLEIGMIVAVEGTFNADGLHGTANSIKFKDNLEGPVTSIDPSTNPLMVLGQTVIADTTTDIYDVSGNGSDINGAKYTLATIGINTGDIVEVSGFVDSTGVIHATYIKVKVSSGGEEVELKGVISDLDVTLGTFKIGALIIDYNSAPAQIEVTGGLQNGQFVEVKSTAGIDNTGVLIASKVEAEDEIFQISGGAEGGKAELEGVVTRVDNLLSGNQFELNGQTVQIVNNTTIRKNDSMGSVSDITLGTRLEVKGTVAANGVITANEISIESEGSGGEGGSSGGTDTGTSGDNSGSTDIESEESVL